MDSSTSLSDALTKASAKDIIELAPGEYELSVSLKIDKELVIRSADAKDKARIIYTGAANSPAFEMNPRGQLKLENVKLQGKMTQFAFASLKSNMSSLYNLTVDDCEISDFETILKAYKFSFSEHIAFSGSTFKNCNNGLDLSEELDDKGEYNAENINIDNCSFEGIDQNVVNYYRGGYDESTVGGNLSVRNSTFSNCGSKEKSGILLNTYGIINVDIADNSFVNNKVKMVALLWGAKNNTYNNNKISNSGKIVVEENLKLKLLY